MSENNKKKQEQTTVEDNEKITKASQVSDSKKETTIEERLKETEDKLLRSLAEIENQRRRFEREIKDAFEFGSFNFAKESLAILDNLERAKDAIKNDNVLKTNKDLDKFLENISIIEKDLISIFEKNRIKKIDTTKKKFDPNLHQAMSEIENEDEETGTILLEMQAGYMFGERLLRPALVGVSRKDIKKDSENKGKKEEK